MSAAYEARYQDRRGVERTTVTNDGTTLRMTLRGVEFAGRQLDDFVPAEGTPPDALESFTLQAHGELCACRLELTMPLLVVRDGVDADASLSAHLDLGDPDARSAIDREDLRLTLRLGEASYASKGESGWFEEELAELTDALPDGTHMKSCFTCAFSDYSPYGHGLFGDLACFRECRAAYLRVETKFELLAIWEQNSGLVQETHLCPEFVRRRLGTGYRG